jgi:phosphoribosylglycinamide formyltransferase-1
VPRIERTFAVMASGQGSNFAALALAAERGELGGRIALLLCDRPGAPVVARAARFGIEAQCPPVGRFRTRIEDERPWLESLRARGVEFVLLAGFMRRLHVPILEAYPGRILNVHPSLLPAFPGLEAVRRAFEAGVRVTGCTVHLVDADLDAGPIVAQAPVEIFDDDTVDSLQARMHAAEHRIYPAAACRFATEPWSLRGKRVIFRATEEASHG